jgi:hypothetical protein
MEKIQRKSRATAATPGFRSILPAIVATAVLVTSPLWSQTGSVAQPAFGGEPEMINAEDRMITPAPVSGGGYSLAFASESARENYLRGGFTFTTAYDDNILPSSTGGGVSDASYSISPWITLNQSRPRASWNLSYAPGFTFYQKTTSRNQADHSLSVDFEYRFSPHVTLTLRDSFVKTSNMFGQFNQIGVQNTSAGIDTPLPTLIAPIVNQLNNTANAELTYQFGPNRMIGAGGTFSELRFPNAEQTPGLYDSSGRLGQAFYAHRLSGRHYLGATYQYQKLFAYPGNAETQTQTLLLFYSVFLKPTLSISAFAGPERSETTGTVVTPFQAWSPAFGLGLGWQGMRTSVALRGTRQISAGNGLSSAVRSNSLNASGRRQLTRTLSAGLSVTYSDNRILDSAALQNGGHVLEGTATLERSFGEHIDFDLGYARLHQSYPNVAAIAVNPDRNRVWVSFSYRFQTALGR